MSFALTSGTRKGRSEPAHKPGDGVPGGVIDRRKQTEPSVNHEILVAGFCDGRNFRQGVGSRWRSNGECTQLTQLQMLGYIRVATEHGRHMPAQQRVDRGRVAE